VSLARGSLRPGVGRLRPLGGLVRPGVGRLGSRERVGVGLSRGPAGPHRNGGDWAYQPGFRARREDG
jgi:hypothetical protein